MLELPSCDIFLGKLCLLNIREWARILALGTSRTPIHESTSALPQRDEQNKHHAMRVINKWRVQ